MMPMPGCNAMAFGSNYMAARARARKAVRVKASSWLASNQRLVQPEPAAGPTRTSGWLASNQRLVGIEPAAGLTRTSGWLQLAAGKTMVNTSIRML